MGLLLLSASQPWAAGLAILGGAAALAGLVVLRASDERRVPRAFATAGFAVASAVAGFIAWQKFFQRTSAATWEPTRRPA